jgi:hypothetical protein
MLVTDRQIVLFSLFDFVVEFVILLEQVREMLVFHFQAVNTVFVFWEFVDEVMMVDLHFKKLQ